MHTPAPHDPSEPHKSSEHDEGGNISGNEAYQPLTESVGDVSMSKAEIGSPPSPVGKMVGQEKKEIKRGDKKGKKAVIFTKESNTELDDEPTPFKRVMSEKGKRFGKDISGNTIEETPIKAMIKGKGKVPIEADDLATEDEDEPVIPQRTSNVRAASTAAKQVSKAPGNKSVQSVPTPTRPKPKPFKYPEPPTPKNMTAKPALNPRPSEDDPGKPQLKLLKLKAPKAKSELSMVKEALKNAQDEVKRAQEAQKRAQEETKKLKERGREPGVCDCIKAVNNGENGKALSSHPPHVSGLSRTGSKSTTHQDQDIASSKPWLPKFNPQAYNSFDGIHEFRSDNAGAISKPTQRSQNPPIDDIFNFGSFDNGSDDDNMVIDGVEPTAKTVGSSKPKTMEMVVGGSGGLAKSGNVSGGKKVKAKEKVVTKSMDKGKAEKEIHKGNSQASHLEGLIVDH